tara:strand:- start:10 stop:534 length:525 start_codon:yes stop_codon:yes gene_type:complete
MISDSFDLHVVDNFLSSNVFLKIINEVPYIEWDSMAHGYKSKELKGKHVWYSKSIDLNGSVAQNIKETIKNKTLFQINKFRLLSFTMATKVNAFPHEDVAEGEFENQLILYIDGHTDINKGTGFYVKNGNNYELNTHIGFQKNRGILFKSGMWHSPLLFNSKDSIPRISIIAQF